MNGRFSFPHGSDFSAKKEIGTSRADKKECRVPFGFLLRANARYLRRRVFKPYLKMLCMRMILFYQKHISKHTCLYRPTCSQYTLESINNLGVLLGILAGMWRILRCNPFSGGGFDPAPERFGKRWLL